MAIMDVQKKGTAKSGVTGKFHLSYWLSAGELFKRFFCTENWSDCARYVGLIVTRLDRAGLTIAQLDEMLTANGYEVEQADAKAWAELNSKSE